MMACQGLYRINPKPPCVMGYEVAGTVESHGIGVTQPPVSENGLIIHFIAIKLILNEDFTIF